MEYFTKFFKLTPILFLLLAKTFASEPCYQEQEFYPCEKIYITAQNVCIFESSIYINLQDGVIKTSGLFSDGQGLFFKDFKRETGCKDDEWECSKCKNCNKNYYIRCTVCKKS